MRSHAAGVALALALSLAACGYDGPIGGALTVTGEVVDFTTGTAVAGTASVSTSGLRWSQTISIEGAGFTLDKVPEYSTFNLLASSPAHRPTFSPAVVVTDADLDGVRAPTVSEDFLAAAATAFGVAPSAEHGILFARLVDEAGAPRAGIFGSAFGVFGGAAVDGPYFLDAQLVPSAAATATTASGWVVYFGLAPGVTVMAAATGTNTTFDMPISPVDAGVVTVAEARVFAGTVTVPTGVSFSQQIVPIFTTRGCIGCHSGKRAGAELGGLKLDGKADKVYDELMERPTRVVVADPDASLVLTMPLREDPPDRHPNITFLSALDPDWLLLKGWIVDGALEN